jgi:hypothetical protein
MKKSLIFILATLVLSSVSFAGLLHQYPYLIHRDLDQMNALVKKKVKEYKKDGSLQILKEAVQAVYSRPNDDGMGMIEKVIPPLRSELDEAEQWENVMDALVDEAIGASKNPKAFTTVVLNTYAYFLRNVIADYKPFVDKPGHERKIVEKIRDAKIELTKEQKNELSLRGIGNHKSPSEIAADVMSNVKKIELENQKAEAADKEAQEKKAKAEKKK